MNVTETSIQGLWQVELDIFEDERGSFRESWQNEKMAALGLPELGPVQCNVSESKRGVIRGIHAEPWDKYIHVPYGTVFGAWVDLRPDSPTFGKTETLELGRGNAVFVTKGIGNSFQATSDFAVYTYLVNDHWKPGNPYPAIAFEDPDLGIAWPIGPEGWTVSEKDQHNQTMREAFPEKYV